MPKTLSRVVFGEPQGAGPKFAMLIGDVPGASYCNRIGPLEHDRVTDLPFRVPEFGLNFQHPTPMTFIDAAPAPGDSWGIFSYHHIELYEKGVAALPAQPLAWVCVDLCGRSYSVDIRGWDYHSSGAIAWGIKFIGDTAYVVFRGSITVLDWIRDLAPIDIASVVTHPQFGDVWGGFLFGMEAECEQIRAVVKDYNNVVFSGHSLGAFRANVACAIAIVERW